MVRHVDSRERESEILSLIVENYIEQSKPISSAYLCQHCRLNYSSATVRNVMLALEKQGFLSHIHTSSGRVPTKQGFKRYVEDFDEETISRNFPISLDPYSPAEYGIDDIVDHTLDSLAQFSGYTSLVAISGRNERMSYKGMRFIMEQPEFEDVRRLKGIFYVLEVKMDMLQSLLFDCIDEKVKILIGDDIGLEEISNCSLVVSGLRKEHFSFALALLGPMRMDYAKAVSCLHSAKNQLDEVAEEF